MLTWNVHTKIERKGSKTFFLFDISPCPMVVIVYSVHCLKITVIQVLLKLLPALVQGSDYSVNTSCTVFVFGFIGTKPILTLKLSEVINLIQYLGLQYHPYLIKALYDLEGHHIGLRWVIVAIFQKKTF